MADEKLNTGPAENISPEAAEPITTPEQTGPAIPESGDVVVSFDKINELMAEKRQKSRPCWKAPRKAACGTVSTTALPCSSMTPSFPGRLRKIS